MPSKQNKPKKEGKKVLLFLGKDSLPLLLLFYIIMALQSAAYTPVVHFWRGYMYF